MTTQKIIGLILFMIPVLFFIGYVIQELSSRVVEVYKESGLKETFILVIPAIGIICLFLGAILINS